MHVCSNNFTVVVTSALHTANERMGINKLLFPQRFEQTMSLLKKNVGVGGPFRERAAGCKVRFVFHPIIYSLV